MSSRGRWCLLGLGVCAVLLVAACTQLPGIAAGGLLHPRRQALHQARPDNCEDTSYAGAGVTLRGWRCRPAGEARGTVVYLHGVADNRGSALGVIRRLTGRGLAVVAYDSRAHGESDGDTCTYGYFEKEDLRRVLDTVAEQPIVLIGTSLGAAVALQEAADDARVSGVVAAEVFSDLRTIARQRAPFVLTNAVIARAFALAEEQGHFKVDDVSPVRAAERYGYRFC